MSNKYDEIREMQNLTMNLLQEHMLPNNTRMAGTPASTNLPGFKIKIQKELNKLPGIYARSFQKKIQLLKDFYSKIGAPKFVFYSISEDMPFNKSNLFEHDYKGIIKCGEKSDLGIVFDKDTSPDYRVAVAEHITSIINQ